MKIIDKNDNVIENPDLTKGYLITDRLFIAHHDAVPAVEEEWHHEVSAVYPNGGKDVVRVVDVPAQEAKEAWDEYEDVQRYVEYTPEEIAEQKAAKEKAAQEAARIPNLEKENKLLHQQVEALSGQNTFLEDCIAEMAGVVYA